MVSEADSAHDRKASFKEGAGVQVRDEDGQLVAATIVRQHRNGDYTVKYDASGKVEKNVSVDRLRSEASAAFAVDDAVKFQEPGNDNGKWRDGTVRHCRKDGTYDILDNDSDEIIKKVPATLVKSGKAMTRKRKEGDEGDEGKSGDEQPLEAKASVQFRNEQGEWCDGQVRRVRSNGRYDIALAEDEVAKNVERRDIRPRESSRTASMGKKKTKKDSLADSDDSDNERGSKRKAPPRANQSTKDVNTSDDDSDGDARAVQGRARAGTSSFALLQVNQLVDFEDKGGRIRRGRIKTLRREQRNCDVEHESDSEKVSKRIPLDVVRPTTTFGRLFGPNRNFVPFQINTHVYYRDKDGVERKGIVLKVSKSSGKTLYDVEDLLDGKLIKQLSAGRLRAVPWLDYSLPSWNGLPSFSLFPAPILRRGMKVRFRRREKETGRIAWKEGVIVKAKSDACCIVEYCNFDGKMEREQVKNADIQARFFQMPFSGMLDGLSLPSIQLPTSLFKVGSAVEVSSGAKVFLGSIVSANEADRTYTIRYDDGRKEKSVSSDRVRLSLRRLRIGTEVEMIVEGPCKEVSKLDGEVAWIHRDEKVAVRINGGNNDVFAEVCTHALMVDGKPAFTAPLSSTWLELMGYYLNLVSELFIYVWFFFGMLVEMDEMLVLNGDTAAELLQSPEHMTAMYSSQQVDWGLCRHSALHNATSSYLLIPSDEMATDRAWLVALLASKAVLTAGCAALVLRCLRLKVSALQDDFIDLKEYQQERVMKRHLAVAMGWALIVTFMTLVNYASLLNRFDFYCLLGDKTLSFDSLALSIDPFAIHSTYPNTVHLLLALAAKTTFNLFRGVTFFLLLFAFPTSGTNFIRRVLAMLPAIAVTALMCAVGGAALHTFYYVQKTEMLSKDELTLSTDTDLSVMLLVLSLWFMYCAYSLTAAAGRFYETRQERQRTSRDAVAEDVLDLAERGEFGLQAQHEALVTKVEQRQDQLGMCKLSILRVYRYVLLHLVASVVSIYIDVTLRQVIKEQEGSSVALHALAFHLAVSVTWLVGAFVAAMCAVSIRQQSPELLAYILDV